MLKDWPEFKSWKKPKRKKLAKASVANRWGGRWRSGDLCNSCRVEISWKDKKGPRSPRTSLFSKRGMHWIGFFPFLYDKVICRQCYDKENKQNFAFLAMHFAISGVFFAVVYLLSIGKYRIVWVIPIVIFFYGFTWILFFIWFLKKYKLKFIRSKKT